MSLTRKFTALLLVLAMFCAACGTVFAASYPDLDSHWAKSYMEDLVSRGMLSGYTDGTMRPDSNITTAESLVFLSHFYSLTETENDAVYEDYGAYAESLLPASLAWARPYLAVCLAAGITNFTEAKQLDFTAAITKEQLSLFLVRAVQMEDTAAELAETELSFPDASSIGDSFRSSVALLAQLKIVSGNTKGEFCPQSNVTRAVVATMVSNLLTYMETNDITLKLAGYTGLTKAEGVLAYVEEDGIILRDFTGICRFYSEAAVFTCTVDGKSSTLTSDLAGGYTCLRLLDGKVTSATITDPDTEGWYQGCLTSITSKSSSIGIYTKEGDATKTFDLTKADLFEDETEISFKSLSTDSFASVRCVSLVPEEVRVFSKTVSLSGTVSGISYGSVVVIHLDSDDDGEVVLRFPISDLPEIKRGSLDVTADRIAVGDTVKATVSGGEVESITISVSSVTGEGTIERISSSAAGTSWTILMEDGSSVTYSLAKNAVAYSGKTVIKISQLTFGDEISFVAADGTITSVTLEKNGSGSTAASEEMTVTVLYVNTKGRTIAALDEDGSLLYIDCTDGPAIVSAAGKTLNLANIKEDDTILVFGSFGEDGAFMATAILVK